MGQLLTVEDFRRKARRRLPKMVFDFVGGGAGAEPTLRDNRAAFERYDLRPRSMVDVSRCSTATTVLGETLSLPVILAPTGLQRLVHRQGELRAAAAAGRARTAYVASTAAEYLLEIADAARRPLWFQLYMWRDGALVESLVGRAARAGYTVLVVTVDVPQVGLRYRDLRNGMALSLKVTGRALFEGARHPRWLWGARVGSRSDLRQPRRHRLRPQLEGDGPDSARQQGADQPGLDLGGPAVAAGPVAGELVVKGVLTAQDAVNAVDADGVVVSNHGGRQLDGVAASLDALPEVVAALGDRCEALLDGGVRCGTDVAKAVALGARAVCVGRPYWWGAGGQRRGRGGPGPGAAPVRAGQRHGTRRPSVQALAADAIARRTCPCRAGHDGGQSNEFVAREQGQT